MPGWRAMLQEVRHARALDEVHRDVLPIEQARREGRPVPAGADRPHLLVPGHLVEPGWEISHEDVRAAGDAPRVPFRPLANVEQVRNLAGPVSPAQLLQP